MIKLGQPGQTGFTILADFHCLICRKVKWEQKVGLDTMSLNQDLKFWNTLNTYICTFLPHKPGLYPRRWQNQFRLFLSILILLANLLPLFTQIIFMDPYPECKSPSLSTREMMPSLLMSISSNDLELARKYAHLSISFTPGQIYFSSPYTRLKLLCHLAVQMTDLTFGMRKRLHTILGCCYLNWL